MHPVAFFYIFTIKNIVTSTPIPRTIGHTFQFNSSTEDSLKECLFDTAHGANNSRDVDILKLLLTQYDKFYSGLIQKDSSECLMMLINS